MPDVDLYEARDHQLNLNVLHAFTSARSREEFIDARDAMLMDFHPSVLSELDRMALSRQSDETAAFLEFLRDHVSLISSPITLRRRQQRLDVPASELMELEAVAAEYLEVARTEPAMAVRVQEQLREALAVLISLVSKAIPSIGSITAQFRSDLGACATGERWSCAATAALQNALLVSFDHPPSREYAERLSQRIVERYGSVGAMVSLSGADSTTLDDVSNRLISSASDLEAILPGWCKVAEQVIGSLQSIRYDRVNVLDGQWTASIGPCPECAMSFATCALVALDTTCSFIASDHLAGFIHLRRGLNRCTCPFCGGEFAIETPAVFYVPDRFAVIYCLPTSSTIPQSSAADSYEDAIELIRTRYATSLSPSEEARYWAAPELFTYSWEKFLDAIQRGEVIAEDHVSGLTINRYGGGGTVTDLAKKFIRELTDTELAEHLVRYGHERDVHLVDRRLRANLAQINAETDRIAAAWKVALGSGENSAGEEQQ